MNGRRSKACPAVLAVICFGFIALASGAGEERVFRDTDGREIVAKIVAATASTVTIAMADGKEYNLPVKKFSDPDRAFISEWLKKNPPAFDYRLGITEDRKRIDRIQTQKSYEIITEETWQFSLKLTNNSGVDLEGLEVRYRIFLSQPVRGKGRERTTSTTDGALALGLLPNNRDIEASTKQFTITTNELDGGYAWSDGTKGKMEEEIEGIYVKVFHHGKNVAEYRAGNKEAKSAGWSDEQAIALKAVEE